MSGPAPLVPRPKGKKAQPDPVPAASGLPGSNPYDEAAATMGPHWGQFKLREDTRKAIEEADRSAISKEADQIALEREKLALAQQRGALVTREEHLARIEAVIGGFKSLLHLLINYSTQSVPIAAREAYLAAIQDRSNSALAALAECVASRRNREQTDAAVQAVFITQE